MQLKLITADLGFLRAITDLAYDGAHAVGLAALALLLWRQKQTAGLDVSVLLLRREIVCLFTMMALARAAEVLARVSVWFELPASGLRISLIGVVLLMIWNCWRRSRAIKGE